MLGVLKKSDIYKWIVISFSENNQKYQIHSESIKNIDKIRFPIDGTIVEFGKTGNISELKYVAIVNTERILSDIRDSKIESVLDWVL